MCQHQESGGKTHRFNVAPKLFALSGVLLVYACSGAESRRAAPSEPSAGAAGSPNDTAEAGAGGAESHAGGSSSGGLLGGASGGGAGGVGGTDDGDGLTGGAGAAGDSGGAGGADTDSPTCNEACEAGACVFDRCLGTTTVATSINLSTTPLSVARQCAEAPGYAVTSLTARMATLSAAATGCLAADDEVLLINLQGTPNATANVGAWELLKVSAVAGTSVTFASAKVRHYGATSDNDDVGTSVDQQRVALIRVPRFGVLDITALGTITANAWDGQLGGVIALRAGQLHLAGKLDASALGYRPGLFSLDDFNCSNSVATQAGESIAGTGTPTSLANFGASGGLGAGTGNFNTNSPLTATPGHATAGEVGTNYGPRAAGAPGGVYGTSDGSRLTLGSGPGGGLTCDNGNHEPLLASLPLFSGHAGGIVLALADEISLTDTGSISASPPQAPRDIAYSGGYILLRGQSLSLGNGASYRPGRHRQGRQRPHRRPHQPGRRRLRHARRAEHCRHHDARRDLARVTLGARAQRGRDLGLGSRPR